MLHSSGCNFPKMSKKKHIIQLQPIGRELQVNDGTPLIDVLHEYGVEFPCGGKGTCGKCNVRLLSGSIQTTFEHRQKLEKLKLADDRRLACMSFCTGDITLEIEQFQHIILADESDFEFSPGCGYGVAVDLGTTTLVTQLVDLSDARVLAVETMLNPQGKFGADLISRIQACLDGHQPEMEELIRSSVRNMIHSMIRKNQIDLNKVVIVGNTVMHHIFTGKNVTPLSAYPFHTPDLGIMEFSSEELNWDIKVGDKVRFYPSIGSFVGSDILAGIAATGMYRKEEFAALIDLGTNGEIAVGNRNGIVCASTAAGPAFEGANISMGMRAVTGAISSFNLSAGVIYANVIGNIKPRGICGSALIDAVAILRKQDAIGMFGEISSGEGKIPLTGNISLTQKDIHEFLLAKAAIAAGLDILTKRLSIRLSDLDAIYIAGGFGNYINLDHVVKTGMILFPTEKIHKMGNTALIGAKMFLFTPETDTIDNILPITTHINLESNPKFQEIYVEKMLL
jgi:uncharacterized 2Fe-2S/4Fe-4S cluster protein (DUF4445 family)